MWGKMINLQHTKIIKTRPTYVKAGRNFGKQAGDIIWEEGLEPYYFVVKNYSSRQIFFKPELLEYQFISKDIIEEDLIPEKVVNVVFKIINFEWKKIFFIYIPLKEFIESKKVIKYDDVQVGVLWKDRPRLYCNQAKLREFIK